MVGTLDTFLANVARRNKIHFCGLLNGKQGEKEYLAWHACFMVVPNKQQQVFSAIVKCEGITLNLPFYLNRKGKPKNVVEAFTFT